MKLTSLILIIFFLTPMLAFARPLGTLQIKVIENGKTLYCLDKYWACYIPKYNLAVFDLNVIYYTPQKLQHTILHEICHHLTYKEGDTYEIREMRADVCAFKFEQLLKIEQIK